MFGDFSVIKTWHFYMAEGNLKCHDVSYYVLTKIIMVQILIHSCVYKYI